MTITPDDLATYLGSEVVDARAQMLIDQTVILATAIVDPLPAGSDAVVLSSASRAYANPIGVISETTGPFTVTRSSPGVYLTRGERRTLRSLAGQGGGAFTINPMSPDAGKGIRDPLQGPTDQESVEYLEEQGL